MNTVNRKNISITNLAISKNNPRHEIVENQREAISVMIEKQSNKLISLAKDIIEFGLNPTKSICVYPIEDGSKRTIYGVLEGNRRVTTLKILANPNIVDPKFSPFIKRIKKLSETFLKNPIRTIECCVFSNTESSLRWIKLEHTGENDGVGVVAWDAQQKARFDKRVKGTTPLALQAIELMQRSNFTPKKVKEHIASLTISNVERLLGDPDVRDLLGIRLQDKNLYTDIEEKEVIKGLTKIANDFLFNEYTVYDIDQKKDRKKYIETFQKSEIPNKIKKVNSPWHLVSPNFESTDPPLQRAIKKNNPNFQERKTLIPRDCIMTIKDDRVNAIYHELKNICVAEFPNATAVLFRVFIELSIDAFISAKRSKLFQGIKKMTSLREKIEKVIEYYKSSNIMLDEQLKAIKVAVQNDHDIVSIDTFNSYVHNRHYNPDSGILKTSWNNMQSFIEKIWDTI
jgi:hypothetical protein